MDTHDKKVITGFTLIELLIIILIVGILAAIAIPVYRGRIDAAKWAEGKAMMGTIATALRVYHSAKGPTGAPPTILGINDTGLGFIPGDLTGTFFVDNDFLFNVNSMGPLTYTITATPSLVSLNPPSYQVDQSGNWTP